MTQVLYVSSNRETLTNHLRAAADRMEHSTGTVEYRFDAQDQNSDHAEVVFTNDDMEGREDLNPAIVIVDVETIS